MYKMTDRFAGFILVFANFWIVFFSSFVSIVVLCTAPSVIETIMNYIAVGVIAEVDNIIF